LLAFSGPDEVHGTVYLCEKGMVAAQSDVRARKEDGSALTHQDIAGLHYLAAESFHAQSLRVAITSVARTATGFLVCQRNSPPENGGSYVCIFVI
jgi:hypothetical protein